MEENLKAYCEYELKNVREFGYDPSPAFTRCYGALMFVLNFAEETYNEDLAQWWSDEIHPQFRELELLKRMKG